MSSVDAVGLLINPGRCFATKLLLLLLGINTLLLLMLLILNYDLLIDAADQFIALVIDQSC